MRPIQAPNSEADRVYWLKLKPCPLLSACIRTSCAPNIGTAEESVNYSSYNAYIWSLKVWSKGSILARQRPDEDRRRGITQPFDWLHSQLTGVGKNINSRWWKRGGSYNLLRDPLPIPVQIKEVPDRNPWRIWRCCPVTQGHFLRVRPQAIFLHLRQHQQ